MRYLVLIICFWSKTLLAQNPDLGKIRKQAEIEYSKLSERFSKADTTLTPEDLKVVYYGFAFEPGYDPEVLIPIENRIRDFNSSEKHQDAISLADSLLLKYPVSIVALFEKSFACAALSLQHEEFIATRKYKALIRTIIDSGDGKTVETAFVIISPNDEFDVIRYFDLTATSYLEISYNGKTYDVLELKRNKRKMEKIYFDISLPAELKEKKAVDALRDK